MSKEEPWQIRAARYCVNKNEFTSSDVEKFILELGVSKTHASNFWNESIARPAGREFNRNSDRTNDVNNPKYFAPLELVSMITDFDELQLARKNSVQAWRISIAALIVSSLGTIFQFIQTF
jgi:hypothetical protein